MTHPMITAHQPDHEIYARQHEGITVLKQPRDIVGSCNACTLITNPIAYTTVTEIHIRSMSIRLCPACLADLKKAL